MKLLGVEKGSERSMDDPSWRKLAKSSLVKGSGWAVGMAQEERR